MADDRFCPRCRSASMLVTNCDKVSPRPLAICRKSSQNSYSRLTLVLRPAMTTECLAIPDSIRPSAPGKDLGSMQWVRCSMPRGRMDSINHVYSLPLSLAYGRRRIHALAYRRLADKTAKQ